MGIHAMDMFYVLQSLTRPPVDVTFSGGLQLQFPGLLGEVCVSQFVIQAMYLQKIGPGLDGFSVHPLPSPRASQGGMDDVQVA